ncbi:unnamed protein product [Prorocentrum cordatum]|uniref:GPI inositol-deacylase n=1 Tax=Prorocentrum cordatum TaxID=2364126 RepID=A0ABN9SAP1_9DINO|nr:unnamed protein product [Polarella glacialis]
MRLLRGAAAVLEVLGVALALVGGFVAFGPYQDDRTWNLMRNSARSEAVEMPGQGSTHFRLREVETGSFFFRSDKREWRRRAPPVLFIPGHMGKWTQVINIAAYVSAQRPVAFFSADFHASASAFHPSIVLQQAEFVAEAIGRIRELYAAEDQPGTQLVLLAHSMGGAVAQKALCRLGTDAGVRALVMLSTPVMGHPLALEPSMGLLADALRREYWGVVAPGRGATGASKPLWTASVATGETDPLVPSEVAVIPPGAVGAAMETATMRDLHSCFSHVNLLFSRHMLHSVAALLGDAVDGQALPEAFRSPLTALFRQPAPLGAGGGSSGSRPGGWRLVASPPSAGAAAPVEPLSAGAWRTACAASARPGAVEWRRLEAGASHLLLAPSGGGGAFFTLLLLEKPRRIKRQLERNTRGDDFLPEDRVQCSELATVRSARIAPGSELFDDASLVSTLDSAAWQDVSGLDLQYPAKACVFHVQAPTDIPAGQVFAVSVERHADSESASRKGPTVVGWAHWHGDPLGAPGRGEVSGWPAAVAALPAVGGALDWAASLLRPREVLLPAGHAVVCRLELPSSPLAPFLPVDVRVAVGASAPWGLQAVFLAAASVDAEVHVGALRNGAASSLLGWAAESSAGLFSPRFAPGQPPRANAELVSSPVLLVLSDPTAELRVAVAGNLWSALGRCFRTYLGYILAAWLGATLALGLADGRPGAERSGAVCILAWAGVSIGCSSLCSEAAGTTVDAGYSPGAPPLAAAALMHLVGAALACACRRATACTSAVLERAASRCCPCRPAAEPRMARAWCLAEAAGWLAAACAHPSGCLVALLARSSVGLALARQPRRRAAAAAAGQPSAPGAAAELEGAWLASLVELLRLDSETYPRTPAEELLAALPGSRHAASPWVDSWLLGPRPELRGGGPPLPALGLVAPALAVSLRGLRPVPAAASRACDCALAVLGGARRGGPKRGRAAPIEPALAAHALAQLAACTSWHGRAGADKVD